MYACIHAPDAGAQARNFSPYVEMVDAHTAVFTLTPRQIVLATDATRMDTDEKASLKDSDLCPSVWHPWLKSQTAVAIASTAEAAILAARNLPGFTFISPGDETRVLGALPLDALPPDPEIFTTLEMWGVRSLADLARLPEHGLAE